MFYRVIQKVVFRIWTLVKKIIGYKQQKVLTVSFHNGTGCDFNLTINEIFKQNNDKRKVSTLSSGNGKAQMFTVGCSDIASWENNFLIISLENMANTNI